MMQPLAEIELVTEGGVLVMRIRGEVDLSNVDEVRDQIVSAVRNDIADVVLDLSATTYLDSTGVRLLFELADRLAARRQRLRLVVADQALVRRVLELTRVDVAVPLEVSVPAALAALAAETSAPG